MVKGWKIIARAANCRCWAMESATSFRAAIWSVEVFRVLVMRGGMGSTRFGRKVSLSASEVISERYEGCSGGRGEDKRSKC